MAKNEIHVNDVGTVFTLTVLDQDDAIVDISSASTLTITFERPDGSKLSKTGSYTTDGTDGKMQYTTISGDLNTHGKWGLQGFIDFGSTEWYTDIIKFTVHRNL